MKYADEPPLGIPEEGPQFWCAICGNIFSGTGKPVFFAAQATVCGGSAMIGVGPGKSTRDEFEAAVQYEVVGEGNLFATKTEMSRARNFYPRYPGARRGMIIGPLQDVSMPDLILFPVTGRQMCMITTAYTYETGEIMSGYGGSATCMITVGIPFLENRPVFTSGDYSGRDFLQLSLTEWLAGLSVLQERRLIYIHHVEWSGEGFVNLGHDVNNGTAIYPLDLKGNIPATPKRLYLTGKDENSNLTLLSLHPFFAYNKDYTLLYIFNELSNKGQPIFRCFYAHSIELYSLTPEVERASILGEDLVAQEVGINT